MDQSGWRKKQDNRPKVNKTPEERSYMCDLRHLLNALLLSQDNPPSSQGVYLCLVSDVLPSSSLEMMPTPFLSGGVSLPSFWVG